MAFTLVQTGTFGNVTVSPASSTFGSNNTLGNLLIFCASAVISGSVSAVSDTAGNTWTEAKVSTANGVSVSIWYVLSCKAGANVVSAVTSGARTDVQAYEYSSPAPASLDAAVNGSTSVGSTSQSATISIANSGELVILAAGNASSGNAMTGGGITPNQRQVASAFLGVVDGLNVSAGASQTASGTWAGSVSNNSVAAAFSATPVFSISGNAQVPGVTISWTGAASGSTTTDASGNFTIPNLIAGSYTVTPTRTGNTFSPTSSNQTVSSSNITGVNFTIATGPITGLVQKAGFATAAATTINQAFSSNNTLGNLLVANVASFAYDVTNVTDSQGNTWKQAGTATANSSIWYAQNCKAGANTVTLNKSSTGTGFLAIAEYSGYAQSGVVLTQTSNGNSVSGTIATDSVFSGYAGALTVALTNANSGSRNWSAATAGYTIEAGASSSFVVWADSLNSVTGLNSYQISSDTSDTLVTKLAVFLPAVTPALAAGVQFVRQTESIHKQLSVAQGGSGPPSIINFPGGNTAGNLIIVAVNEFFPSSDQVTSITDTAGNTYVLLASQVDANLTMISNIYGCNGCAGISSVNNVQANYLNANINDSVDITAFEFTGQAKTGLLDAAATNGALTPSATSVSYSVTTTRANETLFTLAHRNSGPVTWNMGANQTNSGPPSGQSHGETGTGFFVGAPLGATTITVSIGSTALGALTIALAPATGGGGGSVPWFLDQNSQFDVVKRHRGF